MMKRKILHLFVAATIVSLVFSVNAFAVTMYALDGRTAEVSESDVQSWMNVGWYDCPMITVYAPDGRTETVPQSAVAAWQNVGWYTYPVSYVYARDGRVAVVAEDVVFDWLCVGWYRSPSILMYAPDGRTADVAFTDIEAWKKVGWYESFHEARKAYIAGWWHYYNTQEYMEHHSIDVHFGTDGSFYASTWRSQYYGTYVVNGNDIFVNYDLYFCGAGEKTYSYYCSDTWHFGIVNNSLTDFENYYTR